MKKLLTYEQFNESSMADIFQSAHAAVDRDELIPLEDLIGRPKFPTQKQVDAAVEFLNIDPEYLFYDPHNFLNPIVYWKGPMFYGFFGGLDMEALKMTHADRYFEQKAKFFEDHLKRKDYEGMFNRIDKKILIPSFVDMYDEIPDKQKYNVFTDLYVRSEFGFGMFPKDILKDLFTKRKFSADWKKRMQDFKKKAKLNSDGTVTIYRGEGSKSTKGGMSWTLERKTAKFFADRFGSGGKVITRKIDPDQVLDYLQDRGESEVLVQI
jgi:hypothetical protein